MRAIHARDARIDYRPMTDICVGGRDRAGIGQGLWSRAGALGCRRGALRSEALPVGGRRGSEGMGLRVAAWWREGSLWGTRWDGGVPKSASGGAAAGAVAVLEARAYRSRRSGRRLPAAHRRSRGLFWVHADAEGAGQASGGL
jgi:hypothetical protein